MRTRLACRTPAIVVIVCAVALAAASSVHAQPVVARPHAPAHDERGLPDHAPLNPIIASRSGLSTFGWRAAATGWRGAIGVVYGSATELDLHDGSYYVLDGELLRIDLAATRDVGASTFVLLDTGVTAAHAGVGDALFDGFHRLIRHDHAARDSRPRDSFAYVIELPDREPIRYTTAPLSMSDVRIGVGRRHGGRVRGRVQSLAYATLPTATAPVGYRRGVVTAGVINTVRARPASRVAYEGTLGAAWAPRHGPLAVLQRTALLSASSGVRIGVRDWLDLYGLLFYHSPVHGDVGLPELRGADLTIDFGIVITDGSGRQWRVGLVEDTRLTDGGIDLIAKVGVSCCRD
jgi:hypothetical protein